MASMTVSMIKLADVHSAVHVATVIAPLPDHCSDHLQLRRSKRLKHMSPFVSHRCHDWPFRWTEMTAFCSILLHRLPRHLLARRYLPLPDPGLGHHLDLDRKSGFQPQLWLFQALPTS